MKVLYIGPYSIGSTCRMRGEIIKSLLNADDFIVIDTEKILNNFNRIAKSIAFRYKIGPVINLVNRSILNNLDNKYDLIWVDKGIFITKETTKKLKEKTSKIVHYSPDTAFYDNKSKLFYSSIYIYDFCITTKTFEIDLYKSAGAKEIIFCTQGFDRNIHKPYHNFINRSSIVFVGLFETHRGKIIQDLVEAGFEVKLAGHNWDSFLKKQKNKSNFKYFGKNIYSTKYGELISSSIFGLGLLSKRFPELHTTRTFEIPACKTILCTEKNKETGKYFKDDEVVFYNDTDDLINKLKSLLEDKKKLEELSERGYSAVVNGGYDYETIMKKLLMDIGLL